MAHIESTTEDIAYMIKTKGISVKQYELVQTSMK